MKKSHLILLVVILATIGVGYHYRDNVGNLLQTIIAESQPCARPIAYSIGELDPRFGLTKAELVNDLLIAEKIWESPVNKQLFEYSETGALKINLVYDDRQKSTDTLRKMGININEDRSSYDVVKAKYDSLVSSYKKANSELAARKATYDAGKSAYEKEVNDWNSRGGAPKAEFDRLEQVRIDLNNQVAIINQTGNSINAAIDTINSMALVLNKLIATLNLQVNAYNTVGSAIPQLFNEGEYITNDNQTKINIYQFDNKTQLVKVIAHEFGHALGLDHLANSKAIMYYLNEGMNEKLTADDLSALKSKCGIK